LPTGRNAAETALNPAHGGVITPRLPEVTVGMSLPPLQVTPTLMSAVMFAAAMWEFQKIHYDPVWAREREGLDGAILHGPALGNLLARTVGAWVGPRGRIARLAWRNHGVALLERPLTCTGAVSAVQADGRIDCALAIVDEQANQLVSGMASVYLSDAHGAAAAHASPGAASTGSAA